MPQQSQETLQTPHTKLDDLDFSPSNYIQAEYKNSTDIDLTDAMVFFNKSIAKNEHESKQLVTKHFDRFIECKSVLDSIRKHMEGNLHLSNLTKYDSYTLKSIEVPEFGVIKRKDEIRKQFTNIFNLKQNIKNCMSHKEFITCNKKAYNEKISCDSKYLSQIWSETDEERKDFLNNMYDEIFKRDCKFDDMVYFFDCYFEIEELVANHDINRQEKIENTILINIKCQFNDNFLKTLLIAIDMAKKTFHRVMASKMSNTLKKNVIQTFSDQLSLTVKTNKYDYFTYKLVLRECNEITDIIGDNAITSLKYNFLTNINNIKSEMIENIMYNIEDDMDISVWGEKAIKNIIDCKKLRNDLLDDKFKLNLSNIIDRKLTIKKRLEEMEYIYTKFLPKIAAIVNVDEKEFDYIIKRIEEMEQDLITSITGETRKKLLDITSKTMGEDKMDNKVEDVPRIMMYIFELMREHPGTYKKVLCNVKNDIKNTVCLFFVKDIIGLEDLELSREDKMLIKQYDSMFGFLLDSSFEEEKSVNEGDVDEIDEKTKQLRIDSKNIATKPSEQNKNKEI